ncbi:TPA: DUF11 domain-containing protein [Candidatus Berkelbacteria bacterium]|uniref:Conserved repeat domain protein n=1 Tax=Berkelbacteria bacterium GW2011_GWE1_39_12 TaxID=1618337 RepID=A0A0G4B3X8_9BACT|nr:MAG: conserved repeat domain protein [Berkelbacteria bacterium GW2011_GWE1_39_12]HBO60352.1 DUF11 domain-containing protein [Candidatus Berkelbacteria bacterium]
MTRLLRTIIIIGIIYSSVFNLSNFDIKKTYAQDDHSKDYSVQIKSYDEVNSNYLKLWIWDKRPETGIQISDAGNTNALNSVKPLGIRMVETTMDWNDIESSPGVYRPEKITEWQNKIQTMKNKQVEPIVNILCIKDHCPTNVNYENRYNTYKHFAAFAGDMAKQFPQVTYWELWSGMDVRNGSTDLFGEYNGLSLHDMGVNYAGMLSNAYSTIKISNPQALVIMGGLDYPADQLQMEGDNFIQGIYDGAGGSGRRWFDIANIHTFRKNFTNRGNEIRQIMDQNYDYGKPLWTTAIGLDAGEIQTALGYPRTWNTPTNTSDDPAECKWTDLPKNAEGKLIYDSDGFDYENCKTLSQRILENITSSVFQKAIIYQFHGTNANECSDYNNNQSDPQNLCPGAVLPALPANYILKNAQQIDDYGYGIMRNGQYDQDSSFIPRPIYNWLKNTQVNILVNNQSAFATDVLLPNMESTNLKLYAPEGYDYYFNDLGMVIKNVAINSLSPTEILVKKQVIIKSADRLESSSGQIITYTITYNNTTSGVLKKLSITDEIPNGTTYVPNSATGMGVYDPARNAITWSSMAPNPGNGINLKFQVRVN